MKSRFITAVLIFVATIFLSQALAGGGKLPVFSLKDPHGALHQSGKLRGRPLIIIYTAPTIWNESTQKKWCNYLAQTKPKQAGFIMIEDMSAAPFREMAASEMKKEWAPKDVPLLLLDENGGLRKSFSAAKGATCVLVYGRTNKLIHTETGPPSLALAKSLWNMAR